MFTTCEVAHCQWVLGRSGYILTHRGLGKTRRRIAISPGWDTDPTMLLFSLGQPFSEVRKIAHRYQPKIQQGSTVFQVLWLGLPQLQASSRCAHRLKETKEAWWETAHFFDLHSFVSNPVCGCLLPGFEKQVQATRGSYVLFQLTLPGVTFLNPAMFFFVRPVVREPWAGFFDIRVTLPDGLDFPCVPLDWDCGHVI